MRHRGGETCQESSSSKAVVATGSRKPDGARDVERPSDDVSWTTADGFGKCVPKKGAGSETKNTDADGVGRGGDSAVEGDRDLMECLF